MNKHLPGQHNQKTHGRSSSNNDKYPRLMADLEQKGLQPTVSSHPKNDDTIYIAKGDVRATIESSLDTTILRVTPKVWGPKRPGRSLNESYQDLVSNFTQLTTQNIKDYKDMLPAVEKTARDNGYSKLQVGFDRMPVTYAAQNDYNLFGLDAASRAELARAAFFYIEDLYGIPAPENPARYLHKLLVARTNTTQPHIPAKALVAARHPLSPDIPLFLEYLMTNTWQPEYAITPMYVKSLK